MGTDTGGRIRPRALPAVVAALACAVSLLGGAHASPAEAATPARVTDARVASPTISGSTASLTVRWDRAARANSYQVLWSRSRRMTNPRVASTRNRSLTVRRLRQGATYCFQVRGVAGRTRGARSAVVCRATPRRLARAGAAWVSKQAIEGSGGAASTTLTVRWPRLAGATSYELDYRLGRTVQAPGKITRKGIRGEVAVVRGLRPGRIYCFQVRGRNGAGYGMRGSTHCKFTMTTDRRPSGSPFVLDVGSYNVCSMACSGWSARAPKVRDRVKAIGVGVMAVQEAGEATPYLAEHLDGYDQACKTGDGAAWRGSTSAHLDGQSLFIRTTDYSVVRGTANGIQFNSGNSHGACWVELVHRATQHRVIVASVHLRNGQGDAEDRIRHAQTSTLMQLIAEQFPTGRPPIVLAGDFNSHRSRSFDAPRLRLEQSGFHDAYDVAASYDSPTWRNSGHGWSVTPATSTLWGSHIDRVWAPAGAHVRSWRIIEPVVAGRYSELLSDHSPLRVSIQLD